METFSDILNGYIDSLNITAAALAESSGTSPATLSRYRGGMRLPLRYSQAVSDLADGIYKLSVSSGTPLSRDEIFERLNASLPHEAPAGPAFSAKLDTLIDTLGVNVRRLSAHLGVDPSYISRIRKGHRSPAKSGDMIAGIASYLMDTPQKDHVFINLSHHFGIDDFASSNDLSRKLLAWFGAKEAPSENVLWDFLHKINDFDLSRFQKKLHYDDIKIPAIPFTLPGGKTYRGAAGLKQAELDFFRMCATARASSPVFMYSDLPDTYSDDGDFARKRLYGMFACIKRGIQINVVHPVLRGPSALLNTMSEWLPLYMSGQVTPYYLPAGNSPFSHLYYCGGPALLSGGCPGLETDSIRLSLSPKKEDIALGQGGSDAILKGATPLMEVYRKNNFDEFNEFLGRQLALHPDSKLVEYDASEFENLRLRALPGRFVIITKLKSPQVKLVISHPLFLESFTKLSPLQ